MRYTCSHCHTSLDAEPEDEHKVCPNCKAEAGIEPGFSAAALVDDLVVVYTALGRADEAEQWAARRSGGSDEP